MIDPRPEERIHIDNGPLMQRVRVGESDLYCLCRKRNRSLLWSADFAAAREAGIPPGNKGDFVGWIDNDKITFLPTTA